jgi:alanine-glyoxylate transaminase/serine-glyoxylate transaminase/serine-pyruvate transaminase
MPRARWRSPVRTCHDAPVPLSDRLLMGPGPSNPYPEVAQALVGPVLGHLDPEFLALLDATNERLRQVFATANALTLPVSGTGSAGMEASFVNFVRAGDPVVIGVNGVFGERMCEVADRLGAQVIRVDAPWGTSIDPEVLLTAHPAPTIIALVHAETSTGVRNDIAPVGANKGEALLLVDMVTSLGGIEVQVDGWGVDIAYSGTQKCLGVPPGLSPLTVSDRARARMVERPTSWYLDLNLLSRYVQQGSEGGRVYHHTAPVTMIAALHAGLGAILDEGLEAARLRHAECGQLLQNGLEELGLTLFAEVAHRLPQLTTVEVPTQLPHGMGETECRQVLLGRYGIEIGSGAGQLAGKVWRIGCMGHTARRRNVVALLGALKEVFEQ